MTNLLPAEEKKEIKKEYFLRFAVFFAAFTLITLLLAILPALASYLVVLTYYQESLTSKILVQEQFGLDESKKVKQVLRDTKDKIVTLHDLTSNHTMFDVINVILSARVGSVEPKLRSIKIERQSNGMFIATIAGQAADRDSLLIFKKVMQQNPVFQEVTLPVSNFASAKEIEFTMTALINLRK
jgi:predicted membrane protein